MDRNTIVRLYSLDFAPSNGTIVTLNPMQIKTFRVTLE